MGGRTRQGYRWGEGQGRGIGGGKETLLRGLVLRKFLFKGVKHVYTCWPTF